MNKVNIYHHLNYISRKLNGLDVFWFGSSIYGNKTNDIDIMIIDGNKKKSVSLYNSIKKLKYEIIDDCFKNGVDLKNEYVSGVIKEYIKCNKDFDVFPIFRLGPLGDTVINKVYLHIKGVISIDDFRVFAKYFPFQAKSIINNHVHVRGEINLLNLDDEIKLSLEELLIWSNILKRRFCNLPTYENQTKCLNKLFHMKEMYLGNYKSINSYAKLYSSQDDSLSSIFTLLYNQIQALK